MFDPDFPRRRGRHRGQPHQRQAAPPHLRVCRQQRPGRSMSSRARAAPSRLSPARRAGPGAKAPPLACSSSSAARHGGRCTGASGIVRRVWQAFTRFAQEWLDAATLSARSKTDGPRPRILPADIVDTLHRESGARDAPPSAKGGGAEPAPGRRGQEPPLHQLIHQGNPVDAIWFGPHRPLPARVLLAFRLDERMEGRAQGAVSGGRRAALTAAGAWSVARPAKPWRQRSRVEPVE